MLITIQKNVFVDQIVLILSLIRASILNLKNARNLKKHLNEELMSVALHPNRWWNFFTE